MSDKSIKEVGNYIGVFVESCPRNFKEGWKEYLRVRVTIDLTKLLKRRMQIRKSGDDGFGLFLSMKMSQLFVSFVDY